MKLSMLATSKLLISVRLLVQHYEYDTIKSSSGKAKKHTHFCYSSDLLVTTELSFFPKTRIHSNSSENLAQK